MKLKDTKSNQVRMIRTLSLRPDQEMWFTELFGTKRGQVSAFIRSLIDAARAGAIDLKKFKPSKSHTIDRATAYLRAKEAGLMFDADVGYFLENYFKSSKFKIVKHKIYNGDQSLFIADFSVELDKTTICSIVCKSNAHPDRLQLSLGEAIIGQQKTNKTVITCVPYFIDSSNEAIGQFKAIGLPLTDLKGLKSILDKIVG
jgi:hypothetical protein